MFKKYVIKKICFIPVCVSVKKCPQVKQRRHCSCKMLSATRITYWSSIGLLHSEQTWIMSGIFMTWDFFSNTFFFSQHVWFRIHWHLCVQSIFFFFESRLFHYFKTRVLIETKAAGGTFVNAQF